MSGYLPCDCRDCFEITIGGYAALCGDCEEAGCEPFSTRTAGEPAYLFDCNVPEATLPFTK